MSDDSDFIDAFNATNGFSIDQFTEVAYLPESIEVPGSTDIVNSFTASPRHDWSEDLIMRSRDNTADERKVNQQVTESTEHSEIAETSQSAAVDDDEMARLLGDYLATPAPGPVMGTFDGQPIELTEENKAYMADAAAQAGLWLTVKGKRNQHYMTFAPPTDGINQVFIPNTPPETPPETPPHEPSPAPTPIASSTRDAGHTGAGIRKRPHNSAAPVTDQTHQKSNGFSR
ncbi:unnamed protein product [Aureobasidium uvarum]|uniref:Uncharacterized protein n=1 Tax=Aureobasidium uvarum TaxID=2773716 RepID=A0A9N8PQW9_9PEZI|nr:unnamed protein product [Aureobasidium uvarum]